MCGIGEAIRKRKGERKNEESRKKRKLVGTNPAGNREKKQKLVLVVQLQITFMIIFPHSDHFPPYLFPQSEVSCGHKINLKYHICPVLI